VWIDTLLVDVCRLAASWMAQSICLVLSGSTGSSQGNSRRPTSILSAVDASTAIQVIEVPHVHVVYESRAVAEQFYDLGGRMQIAGLGGCHNGLLIQFDINQIVIRITTQLRSETIVERPVRANFI
jgi:hypothetical protein